MLENPVQHASVRELASVMEKKEKIVTGHASVQAPFKITKAKYTYYHIASNIVVSVTFITKESKFQVKASRLLGLSRKNPAFTNLAGII